MKSIMLAMAVIAVAASPVGAGQAQNRIVVEFAADSDEVSTQSMGALSRFARTHPDKDLLIEGHATLAESENSPDYATGLSHRRSAKVRMAIWNDDVERRQFSAQRTMTSSGYGASRPLDGIAPDHRRNRRVEVSLRGPDAGW
ncbi:hypothetical protein E4341_12435 [Brevundimonas sp. 'scallop']|nr:hypothetical protein E4341_12435 [Brevundimonas sp. 'scallop']